MALTHAQMIPTDHFGAARRRFLEIYGSLAVMNTYLKLALVLSMGVNVGLIFLCARFQRAAQDVTPLIIRIDEVGRAEAIRYADFTYQPREPEIRYFLTEFVTRHYGRLRATLRDDYARSLYFLDARLAEALIESNRKSGALETFLAGEEEEAEVQVKNVVLQDLRSAPYKAAIDFDKVYLGPDRSVLRREHYVANVVFVFQTQVANARIPVNPLGLTITYFRQDQAFR